MSKLEELIAELCPDGVEYISIGSVMNYEQPTKYIVKDTNYSDEFLVPVLTAGQSFILGYTNETDGFYDASKEHPVIIFDDFTGAFKWVDFTFKVKSSAMKMLTAKNDKASLRYLFHIMGNIGYSSDEHKRLWISIYSAIKIPLPPLSVQREIVRILDNFTELTAELTAELTTRKKQYEYYSKEIISSADNTELLPIRKLGKWTGGGTPSMSRKDFWDYGTIPWITSKDMKHAKLADSQNHITELSIKNSPAKILPENSVAVVVRSGILKHTFPVAFIPFASTINQDLKAVVANDDILPKYIFYVLYAYSNDILAKTKKQGGTVDSLDVQKFFNYLVPIPPLEEQERIVAILDRFDTLTNDLSIGLPAEIEARRKQYEYYRDKLLTFKEKSS